SYTTILARHPAGHAYRILSAAGWPDWAGKNRSNLNVFSRRAAGIFFWVLGFGFWVLGFWLWVFGFGFWVLGFGFRVLGFGFWVLGFGFCVRSAPNKFCRRSRQGGSCPFVPARSLAKPIASFG